MILDNLLTELAFNVVFFDEFTTLTNIVLSFVLVLAFVLKIAKL